MSDRMIRVICGFLAVCTFCVCLSSFEALYAQTAFSEQDSLPTVVLDAGHGGEDGGCVGINGAIESRINLSVCLRIRDLCVFCGIPVTMIRETDCAVYQSGCKSIAEKKVSDIKERTRMVNETPNAVLVSIHENYFPQQKYHGAQVFYANTSGSQAFAESMQTMLRDGIDAQNKRLAKPSKSVYLLEHVSCPAILIECGFLSNPEEADLLLEPEYQKKLSAVICAGIGEFLNTKEHHEI